MANNSYESPALLTAKASVEQRRRPTTRPVGVSILSVLHLVGGVLLFVSQFLIFDNRAAWEEYLRSTRIPLALLIFGVMFLAILTISSGVGLWIGTKWGWWLASFYYAYSIFRYGSALFSVIVQADEFEGGRFGPEYYMIRHGGSIVIHFLLFLYLFQANVLEFSGFEHVNKAKAVGILVGICLAISAAMSVIVLISN